MAAKGGAHHAGSHGGVQRGGLVNRAVQDVVELLSGYGLWRRAELPADDKQVRLLRALQFVLYA